MPGTRAQSKSRGGTGATSLSAVENSVTADLSDNPPAGGVIGNRSQGEMSGAVPTDISDPNIVLLRAKVTKARKDVNDCSADVADQVKLIKEKTAEGRATPLDALMRYKQALKNMIEEGDLKLTLFHNTNGELVEKLEGLILTAPGNTDLLARTTSLRDKVVG